MARLTRNFDSSEFVVASHVGCAPTSPWTREIWWSETILQPLRYEFGVPIRITSYNRCIPGRVGSGAHGLGGEAIDFVPLNVADPKATLIEMVRWLGTYKAEHIGKALVETSPLHAHLTTRGPESFRADNFEALLEDASEPGGWLVLRTTDTTTSPTSRTKMISEAEAYKEGTVSETYKEIKPPVSDTGIDTGDTPLSVAGVSLPSGRLLVLGSIGFLGGIVLARI